ncbi:hypothetical protein ACFU8W_46195 [Streptomyces sp. NPDC057565]|uniref:hypothetical protein n=1 Tax=Streptomyces sp. NPDC057565 TaxID=3346169 RepID=UPI00367F4AA6
MVAGLAACVIVSRAKSSALNTVDENGAVTKIINKNQEVHNAVKSAADRMWRAPSMKAITGGEFEANPHGVPRLKGEPRLPKLLNGAGALGNLLFIWDGMRSLFRGDQPCDVMGDCPVPEVA